MSDILSKLKALGVTKGMPEQPKKPSKSASEQAQMDALLKTFSNGLVVENDHGYAFINRLRQPLSQPHGQVDMAHILQFSPLFDSIMECHIGKKEDTLAFDTETSGLSNGSGSFIFMMGLGYFEEDSYVVDQLILPDLSAESAFLRQTELIFGRYPILLSYNGKSFDIPMLQSRMHFHMFPDFTREITHIDLLKLTRRYWKQALGTVPLSNIEHYLLKLQRGDEEVPGYLAPELYRDFLRDCDAEHIAGVAYHNQIDVVSLSAFLLYINDITIRAENDPALWKENNVSETALMRHNLTCFSGKVITGLDGFTDKEKKSMASKFMKSGETEKAIQIYENLAANGDYNAAEKLMKHFQKSKDTARFEVYRALTIRLIEQDETIGKWTKEAKLSEIRNKK
ncbi:MAG: ribonuclease H-like domain-containing protein [Anaerolineaceae bacterium]|nr:ribonuclease H-like domain-containing protein [Anaerolineaceae bacterium]